MLPNVIVTLTNKDRADAGLTKLSVNPTLEIAAKLKAVDMAKNEYFAHTSPQGLTPWHWFQQADYSFIYAGENLAVNFDDADAVERAWLNSPTHKANIMNGNYTEMGVATAEGMYKGRATTYVVELFGTPAISKPTVVAQEIIPEPKPEPTPIKTGDVAGESVEQVIVKPSPKIAVVEETPTYVSVVTTDTTLVEKPLTQIEAPKKLSWYENLIVHADKYIGTIIEIIIIMLILATASMTTRELQKHHRMHMAYGILMTVILTSSLFVGRIGVFAEAAPPISNVEILQ